MWIRNKSVPNKDPCGTPHMTRFFADQTLFTVFRKISVHLNSTEYRQICWDPYSLGFNLTLQSSMSWRKHIVQVYEEASKRFSILKFVTYKLHSSILTSLYKSLIRPLMEYGDVICCDCEHIINLGQHKTLHNFHVELLAFKSLSFHLPLMAGILWT